MPCGSCGKSRANTAAVRERRRAAVTSNVKQTPTQAAKNSRTQELAKAMEIQRQKRAGK